AAAGALGLGDEGTGEGVDPAAELELLAAQCDPADELASAAGDAAVLVLELEALVAELDLDPAHGFRPGHEALLPLDLYVPGHGLGQLGCQRLDEHLEVGAVGAERGGDKIEVSVRHQCATLTSSATITSPSMPSTSPVNVAGHQRSYVRCPITRP